MKLERVIGRRTLTILGLNSGTSADSLDMAAVTVRRRGNGIHPSFVAGREKKLPPALRRAILDLSSAADVSLDQLVYLDNALGAFFGKSAAQYIAQLRQAGTIVHAVASHGQTVRHLPRPGRLGGVSVRGSLQLASLDRIAAATELTTVGDFRQADIASGGEGAPITGGAMMRLLGGRTRSRLIVNIGGMANYFYLPKAGSRLRPVAADCGPGNSLCDILASELFEKAYDRGGRLSRCGRLSQRLLSLLLAHPFYRSGRASTGREEFGLDTARRIIRIARGLRLRPEDIMRTAAELTTLSIASAVWPTVQRDGELSSLYLTGGGRRNRFFVDRLRHHLPDLEIRLIDELGVDGNLVEAAAFALLGEACLRSDPLAGRISRPAGKNSEPVLGRIVQPPQRRRQR